MLHFEIMSLKVMISCSVSESDVDSVTALTDSVIHSENDSSDCKQLFNECFSTTGFLILGS